MRLNSTAFADGSAIPRRFTCDGEDLSPPLNWSDAPTGTRSFALLCDDPDAPAGTWHHWAAYDIPATLTMLALGAASDAEKRLGSSRQSMIFNGPATAAHARRVATACISLHHYHFRLLALSVDHLPIGGTPSCREVEREARRHTFAEGTLVGVYKR
ncbi:MAG TPA: YbhB/YbcL family Raf kinase inhibitor-like protein [Bradyrhizobium sp.]|nr:YbhB/YbcL family Raf kinase inhibitor-like protein [Bradyrhizobium sp.]